MVSTSLVVGFVGVLVAAWVHELMRAMPAPFDDLAALAIPPERLALYPGNANGSNIPAALDGAFTSNEALKAATRLFQGVVVGSESVAVSESGTLVMCDRHGFVFQARPSLAGYALEKSSPLYIGPERLLGFHVLGDDLYVCDSLKGLVRVKLSTGATEVLSNAVSAAADGAAPRPFNYANDLDISSEGIVYFTASTDAPVARNAHGFYDTMRSALLSSLRGADDGRLLRWDPRTRQTSVLLDGLAFANGVALSADESWVAVVETNLARVQRHWLRGPRAGQTEVLVDRLPGLPDGISRSPDGGFWVGLVVPLSPIPKFFGPYRPARQLLSHLISRLYPLLSKRWGAVVKLDAEGRPVRALFDTDGSHVATVSAVTEVGGRRFLGNLGGDFVSYVDLE